MKLLDLNNEVKYLGIFEGGSCNMTLGYYFDTITRPCFWHVRFVYSIYGRRLKSNRYKVVDLGLSMLSFGWIKQLDHD